MTRVLPFILVALTYAGGSFLLTRWEVFFITILSLLLAFRLSSRIPTVFGLLCLLFSSFFLVREDPAHAEIFANGAYIFFAIAVIVRLRELFWGARVYG